jgi:hypothetical protein
VLLAAEACGQRANHKSFGAVFPGSRCLTATKSEARNPKSETISNDQNSSNANRSRTRKSSELREFGETNL